MSTITSLRGTRLAALLVAATASVAAALAVGAATASAASVESGYTLYSPGWVSAHSVAVASPPTTDAFSQISQQVAGIGFDRLQLYASAASNQTQVVTVTNTVKSCFSNLGPTYLYGCSIEGSRSAAWYVQPGSWATIGNRSPLDVAFYTETPHVYFAQLTVTWTTLSGGLLGRLVVDYTGAADVQCRSTRCGYRGAGDSWGYVFSNT